MRVKDLMSTIPITVDPATPVLDAQKTMRECRIRHLLVMEDGQLVGIVTDRDIRLNLASPATSLSIWELNHLLARMSVRDVMKTSLIIIDPNRDAGEAATILLSEKIGALPVVAGAQLVGIVTESDFVRAFVKLTAAA
jgi:acetoin utilization protein AcuB